MSSCVGGSIASDSAAIDSVSQVQGVKSSVVNIHKGMKCSASMGMFCLILRSYVPFKIVMRCPILEIPISFKSECNNVVSVSPVIASSVCPRLEPFKKLVLASYVPINWSAY